MEVNLSPTRSPMTLLQLESRAGSRDPNAESEAASARWAWNWVRSHPEILINGSKRWNRLELDEVLALPEDAEQPSSLGEAIKPEHDTEHRDVPPGKYAPPSGMCGRIRLLLIDREYMRRKISSGGQ